MHFDFDSEQVIQVQSEYFEKITLKKVTKKFSYKGDITRILPCL
jgi:hypothetical protein